MFHCDYQDILRLEQTEIQPAHLSHHSFNSTVIKGVVPIYSSVLLKQKIPYVKT